MKPEDFCEHLILKTSGDSAYHSCRAGEDIRYCGSNCVKWQDMQKQTKLNLKVE